MSFCDCPVYNHGFSLNLFTEFGHAATPSGRATATGRGAGAAAASQAGEGLAEHFGDAARKIFCLENLIMSCCVISPHKRCREMKSRLIRQIMSWHMQSRPVLHSAGTWAHAGVRGPLGPSNRIYRSLVYTFCFVKYTFD